MLAVFVAVFITGDVSTTLSSITDGALVEGVLLVRLLIHHVHAALILIEDLHLLGIEPRFLQKIGGRKTLIEGVARHETPKTHLHERPEVAWRAVREIHDPARLAVDHEDVTFANVSGFHGSGNLNQRR